MRKGVCGQRETTLSGVCLVGEPIPTPSKLSFDHTGPVLCQHTARSHTHKHNTRVGNCTIHILAALGGWKWKDEEFKFILSHRESGPSVVLADFAPCGHLASPLPRVSGLEASVGLACLHIGEEIHR